jgi:hypothetical protein
MKKQWLIISFAIALIGVLAGVGSFLLTRYLIGGKLLPPAMGLITVLLVDIIVFLLFYQKMFKGKDGG